ncbi:MAG TPA: formyltetrahydrofolate deformylase [bacterium]|nr:formyltetrahydrofolate deformylase [bacterium]HPJ72548.1 formyltetrahydrofolate deformylase [bacterium]HPQ65631.1 formyltetrahydrofolate deformylase [bacterium]
MNRRRSAVLLIHCPDRQGLVVAVTGFIQEHRGNIVHLDEVVDGDSGTFFMRVEWELEGFTIPPERIAETFQTAVAAKLAMVWSLYFSEDVPRMAIFVSHLPHCLYDLLARRQAGEWRVDIPLIVGNHPDLEDVARRFGIDFYCFPVDAGNKSRQEAAELELLERNRIDFIVLARYMQILSGGFVARYPNRIINIHHSFLPAFPGARPYHSAYERGVKIIGATSHYVSAQLDEGPIIAQDVIHLSHKDQVADLIRKGRDLEKTVLARAVWHHLQRRILVFGNRTVVFD